MSLRYQDSDTSAPVQVGFRGLLPPHYPSPRALQLRAVEEPVTPSSWPPSLLRLPRLPPLHELLLLPPMRDSASASNAGGHPEMAAAARGAARRRLGGIH